MLEPLTSAPWWRIALATIAGYALWSLLWLGGNYLFLARAGEVIGRGEAFTERGPLLFALALSMCCSLAAGAAAAALGKPRVRGALIALCAALLLTGIGVQSGVWERMPLWYHLAFLALLAPMAWAGAWLARGRGARGGALHALHSPRR